MEKRVKKSKKNDYSKLSNIKDSSINIKSLFKFNILNSLIVIIVVYFAIIGFNLFGYSKFIGFRSPNQPPVLGLFLKFILIASIVLSVLGWLVLAYYKRLNNERSS